MMNDNRYREYLQGREWADKAKERLRIDGYKCVVCGSCGVPGNELQIHHLTYARIYEENIYTDLATLCRTCHKNIHRLLNRVTSADGRHGWQDRDDIPAVSTYTLSGVKDEHREL